MDGQPVQFVKETHEPLPLTTDHALRVDYERAGTKAVFMFCEVLEGSRNATAHERSTRFKSSTTRQAKAVISWCEEPIAQQANSEPATVDELADTLILFSNRARRDLRRMDARNAHPRRRCHRPVLGNGCRGRQARADTGSSSSVGWKLARVLQTAGNRCRGNRHYPPSARGIPTIIVVPIQGSKPSGNMSKVRSRSQIPAGTRLR